MPPKQPTTTTQISEVKLPEWVDKASQSNYEFAQQIASKPYQAYGGGRVASPGVYSQLGVNELLKNLDAGKGALTGAENIYSSLGGYKAPTVDASYTPDNIQAGQFAGTDLTPYMNPWIDNVETHALGALDKQRHQALMSNSDKAAASSAFGGSRHGIVDAVTNAEAAQSAGLLSADLRKQGFDNATRLAVSDIDRSYDADKTNQSAGLAGAELRMRGQTANQQASLSSAQIRQAAASGLISTSEAQRMLRDRNVGMLSTLGAQDQQYRQSLLDDSYNRWQSEQDHDINQLNVLLSSLGMSPYGKSESSTKTTSGGGGTDFAQMGLGIFSLLLGLPGISDKTEKTDIKKVGEKHGVPVYSYRYKGDPKTYPKVVGPMAQDIEKKWPGTTGRTSEGKMTVPVGVLAEFADLGD